MATLKDTRTGPPGGWRYVQPETGCEIVTLSYPETVERMMQHRTYRKLSGSDSATCERDLQRQICSAIDPRFCTAEPGETHSPIVDEIGDLTMSKLTAGTISLIAFLKGGGEIVSKTEAAERAHVCRGCRFNRNADGCGVCFTIFALIEAAIPAGRTEPGLKACSACGCGLKAKVLMPQAVLDAGNAARPVRYPAHCWQFKPTE